MTPTFARKILARGRIAATSFVLVACGGGGGGSPVFAPGPSTGPVTITSANARDVAVDVFTAVSSASSMGLITTLLFAPQGFGGLVNSGQSGVLAPLTQACTWGGSVTVDADIAVGGTLTPGDELHAVFDDCSDYGALQDGDLRYTVTAFAGDIATNQFDVAGTLTVTGLRQVLDQTGHVSVTTGTFQYGFDSLTQQAQGVFAQTRQAQQVHAGNDTTTYTLTDLVGESSLQTQPNPDHITSVESGTLVSPILGGSVDFDTPDPLVYSSDNDPLTGPFQGQRVITGKGGATITVVILDPLNARLDIDLDGDGSVDDMQPVPWSELNL